MAWRGGNGAIWHWVQTVHVGALRLSRSHAAAQRPRFVDRRSYDSFSSFFCCVSVRVCVPMVFALSRSPSVRTSSSTCAHDIYACVHACVRLCVRRTTLTVFFFILRCCASCIVYVFLSHFATGKVKVKTFYTECV